MLAVTDYLLARGDGQDFVAPAFDLHHAAFRFLSRQRLALQTGLELAGGKQPEIGIAGAGIP